MEKKINPSLNFVRPEHYNQMLQLFVWKQEREKKIGRTYSLWNTFFDFYSVSYQPSASLSPNGFTHLRPVIYLQ